MSYVPGPYDQARRQSMIKQGHLPAEIQDAPDDQQVSVGHLRWLLSQM